MTIEEAVAGLVPNVAVIPVGQPDGASVTGELKPLNGVMVTVDVPVEPSDAVAAGALKVKLGDETATTVQEMVVLADNVPLVPLTESV